MASWFAFVGRKLLTLSASTYAKGGETLVGLRTKILKKKERNKTEKASTVVENEV